MGRRNGGSARLFLSLCLATLGTWGFLAVSVISWISKDGLGPDVVESHGLLALRRYFAGTGWHLLVSVALLLSGFLLYRSDARRDALARDASPHP